MTAHGADGRPRWRYYRCHGRDCVSRDRDRPCPQRQAQVEERDAAVWEHVQGQLNDPVTRLGQFEAFARQAEESATDQRAQEQKWQAQRRRLDRSNRPEGQRQAAPGNCLTSRVRPFRLNAASPPLPCRSDRVGAHDGLGGHAMIVRALREIQQRYGYLPEKELEFVALRANVPLYRVQEIASFFPSFRRKQPLPGLVTVQVCQDMTCHLRGAATLQDAVWRQIRERSNQGTLCVEAVSCLGRCDRAPAACVSRHDPVPERRVHEQVCAGLNEDRLRTIIETVLNGKPLHESPGGCGGGTKPAWQIDVYDPSNGHPPCPPFSAVRRFLQDPQGTDLIRALGGAGLLGMGGALGRAAKKWQEVQQQDRWPKYVVCNADESEPGTFKDRELLLHTPHLVVEGMLLAGLFLKATRGYVYIRHEYPEQVEAVEQAIRRARKQVPEAFQAFDVEVFVSPGGYICGEQSALLEVLEDRRAQPRNAPPEVETNGLFDQPTLINNVETLAWVPAIVLR